MGNPEKRCAALPSGGGAGGAAGARWIGQKLGNLLNKIKNIKNMKCGPRVETALGALQQALSEYEEAVATFFGLPDFNDIGHQALVDEAIEAVKKRCRCKGPRVKRRKRHKGMWCCTAMGTDLRGGGDYYKVRCPKTYSVTACNKDKKLARKAAKRLVNEAIPGCWWGHIPPPKCTKK